MKKAKGGAGRSGRVGAVRGPDAPARRPYQSVSPNGSTPRRGRPHPQQLDQAVQRYADLYDLAPIGYVSFDRSGRIQEINLMAAQLFGTPRERLIGMPVMVFVAREDTPLFLHHLLRCRCSDTRVETELRLKNVKRKIIHAYLSSTPIAVSAHNGALLYQTAIIDLTRRKAAEAALREKEAELECIVTQTPFMLSRCTSDLRYRYVSRAYAQMLGRTPEELTGKRIVDFIGKEALAAIRPYIEAVLSDQTITFQAEIPYQNSERRVIHSVYVPDKNAAGEIIGWIASLFDVTEEKRAQEKIYESEASMRAIVEQATAGMAREDRNGRISFVNRRFCEIVGYDESEILGRDTSHFTHPDDRLKTRKFFRELVSKAKPFELEKRYLRKDGSIVWVSISGSPVRAIDGKVQSAIAIVVDITARKVAEAQLQRSKELLEKLVQRRTKALREANTELKSEIERRKGLEGEILAVSDREQQRLGQELHDGLCQHLTAVAFMARSVALRLKNHRVIDAADIDKIGELVNNAATDTRNLSRALHRVDVDAAGLVIALKDLVDREIWKIPCRLEVKPSFRLDDDVAAAQFYCIARELVINANKHAQAREIVVKLEHSRRETVLRVIDDGVGFSNEQQMKPGLGFHIMRYRAQSIGGRLKIDSPKRGGTCISCYLPDGAVQTRKSQEREREREREREDAPAKRLARNSRKR